ncbi:MAG: hypothetical protein GPJ54_04905 [Candidatus Heimdallarchaeota archaeon]|nr:hypothetical protein [Candidatus Heimdallarchaeota archaeon]
MSDLNRQFRSTRKIDFVFEFLPDHLNLGPDTLDTLNNEVINVLKNENDVKGLSIVSIDGTQPFVISKSNEEFQKLTEIGSVVQSLNPKEYFKQLSEEIEYKGLGHLVFDEFDIYFARVNPNFAVAIHLTAIKLQVFTAAEKLVNVVRNALKNYVLLEKNKFTMDEIRDIMKNKSNSISDK